MESQVFILLLVNCDFQYIVIAV